MQITAFYAGLLAFLLLFLSARVIAGRRAGGISLGTGGDPAFERRVRAHGNLVEYAPIGLVLLLVLEMGGTAAWVLYGLGGMLLLGRALHAFALSRIEGGSFGRVAGMVLTLAMIGLSGGMCLRLAFFG